MAAGATVGARFVVLDDAVKPAGLMAGEEGLSLNWRVGASPAVAVPVWCSMTPTGCQSLWRLGKSHSSFHPGSTTSFTPDALAAAKTCSGVGARPAAAFVNAGSVPLGESGRVAVAASSVGARGV